MRLGIHLPQIGRKAGPQAIRRAAEQAEQLGFADVWTSEHIILPDGAPYPPSPSFYDPVLALTWAAAYTSRVRLGTSVLILPMRHPLPLAKELATLQNLSGGRFILGAGVGWLEAEFEALGVPFHERGRRMDEGIAMMRAVWSEDEPALKRALRHEGWHGSRATPEQAAPIVARLRSDRPDPDFAVSLRSAWDGRDDGALRARLQGYQAVGVEHVLVEPYERELTDWLGAVDRIARAGEGMLS
jgi:alkanesulfonate monooxygenase SsuD/methylene tetrahydromethanopterin reductase-like flavin-dependent oxidoreductase (luciferase family)